MDGSTMWPSCILKEPSARRFIFEVSLLYVQLHFIRNSNTYNRYLTVKNPLLTDKIMSNHRILPATYIITHWVNIHESQFFQQYPFTSCNYTSALSSLTQESHGPLTSILTNQWKNLEYVQTIGIKTITVMPSNVRNSAVLHSVKFTTIQSTIKCQSKSVFS